VQVYHKSSGAEGEKNLKARGAAKERCCFYRFLTRLLFGPLQLYELSSGRVALALGQKQFNRDRWPTLQFADDESVALRTVSNEVQLYSPADFATGLARRLRVPGVSSASMSPGPAPVVATFVSEAKGAPGCVRIHALPSCAPGEATEGGPPLARRSFFRVSHVRFRWNAPGTALLLLASADVDATNQSYYGESSLHFLRVDASVEGAVPLPKDGPVHDVAWSPRGTEFVAVYGFMPARVTLFSDSLKVLHELPGGALNTARWNPFGRFLALAGFGNLPGDVSLLDRKADGKCKPMAETRLANSVSIEWSPCGRALLTATTAPRLQVDNGFRVVRYTGEVLFTHAPAGQLYAAEWQPAEAGVFADRPQTPGAAAAAKAAPSVVAAAKAPAYRPPGAAVRAPEMDIAARLRVLTQAPYSLCHCRRAASRWAAGPPSAWRARCSRFSSRGRRGPGRRRLARQERSSSSRPRTRTPRSARQPRPRRPLTASLG
jgi:translation initiation factor 2A